MNKYSFMITFKNTQNEAAFINCEANDWDSPVESEKIINIFAEPFIKSYLSNAFISHGYLFNPTRHSPCQLYQALINNPEWEIVVDSINCELPDPLLPSGDTLSNVDE